MASHIPVYGLNGIDTSLGRCGLRGVGIKYQPHSPSRAFGRYVNKIKNPAAKAAAIARHSNELATLNGIYNISYNKITDGSATQEDFTNLKKVNILIALDQQNVNAYRFAKILMPYVIDIDANGDYYFDNLELAQAAAEAEEQFFKYCDSPAATEYGIQQELGRLDGWFKNLINKTVAKPLKWMGKTIAKSVTAPINASIKASKAGVNMTKAAIQAIGGNTAAAKESLKKAWEQTKEASLAPVKATGELAKEGWQITKDVSKFAAKTTKDVFRTSVKIAGKLFKVLFVNINPVTVSIRATLRSLISINFIGLATRLNVGLMTKEQAQQQGYSEAAWEKAKKGLEKLVKFYKKMGGKESAILKTVKNGASRRPIFKKDIKGKTITIPDADNENQEASLGWVAEAAAIVSAVVSIITAVWQMVAKVVKAVHEKKEAKTAAEQQAQQEAKLQQMLETYANDGKGNFYVNDNGDLMTWEQYNDYLTEQETTQAKRKKILIIGGIAAAAVAGLMLVKK